MRESLLGTAASSLVDVAGQARRALPWTRRNSQVSSSRWKWSCGRTVCGPEASVLPVELDLGLACEEGVPRWRLQYEIDGGFRVLHLDARNGAVLYDRFDEWRS